MLPAITLGSHNKVSMADLKALLAGLGMKNPQSQLQSGNLVFASSARATAPLEKLLETSARNWTTVIKLAALAAKN